MGVLDFIYATADSVSQNSKNHVYNFSSTSYSYGCAAASQIGNAVQNLNQQLQKEDTRRFATDIAKNAAFLACRYGLKTVLPGELVNTIVPPSFSAKNKLKNSENKKLMELESELEDHKQEVKELRAVIEKMEKEVRSLQKDQNHKIERERKVQNHKMEKELLHCFLAHSLRSDNMDPYVIHSCPSLEQKSSVASDVPKTSSSGRGV